MTEIIFKKDALKIESLFIDKEMATDLLSKNVSNNRKLNKKVVSSYARQMLKGLWQSASGESIKLTRATPENQQGLTDGQHRLAAVIEAIELDEHSNTAEDKKFSGVEMLVISNVPREAMATIDDNFKRTLSDSFAIANMTVKHQSVINGALKVLMTLRSSTLLSRHYESVNKVQRVSNAEMLEFFEKLPNFNFVCDKYFRTFRHARLGRTLSGGISLAMYYLLHEHDLDACFSVFKTLETGIPQDGKGENSPAFLIYNRGRTNRENKVYMRPWQVIMQFVWAYDKTVAGQGVTKMPPLATWDWLKTESKAVQFAKDKLLGVNL